MEELKKQVAELEIARSRLTQEGGDLGKQVEEYENKLNALLKGKKTLEVTVEELKRANEEETRVRFNHYSHILKCFRVYQIGRLKKKYHGDFNLLSWKWCDNTFT